MSGGDSYRTFIQFALRTEPGLPPGTKTKRRGNFEEKVEILELEARVGGRGTGFELKVLFGNFVTENHNLKIV